MFEAHHNARKMENKKRFQKESGPSEKVTNF